MSLPQTPSFQHKHLYLINKLSSPSRPSHSTVDIIIRLIWGYSHQALSERSSTVDIIIRLIWGYSHQALSELESC